MFQKHNNPLAQCQLKFDSSDDATGEFEGYASVFGVADSDNDTIYPGAFAESVAKGERVKMFVNHDQRAIPIGGYSDMKEDDHGLFVRGQINLEHRDGPSLYSALKANDLDALSIGFTMNTNDWDAKEGFEDDPYATMWGNRDIKNLTLREISVVSFPANDPARISDIKSESGIITLKDLENHLREVAGFSKSQATAFCGLVVKASRSDSAILDDEQANALSSVSNNFGFLRDYLS